jgi:hemolysin III
MVAGGVAYTAGAVAFYFRRPDPWPTVFGYHEVWHACTVVAGAAHFVMVWLVVSR